MKQIPLTQGKFAIVDDEDFERVNAFKWQYHCDGYATSQKSKMHRFILNAPKGMVVDHKNHDGLDNRKENIWICTNSQNQLNRNPNPRTPKQIRISKNLTEEIKAISKALGFRISLASMVDTLIRAGIVEIKRENKPEAD